MSSQSYEKLTLRDHRRRGLKTINRNAQPVAVTRASWSVRSDLRRVEKADTAPLIMDLTSAYIVKRQVYDIEQSEKLESALGVICGSGAIERIGSLGISLFDKTDYRIALRYPGTYTNHLRDYVDEYASRFSPSDTMLARIGGMVISGAGRKESGSRFLGFGFQKQTAEQLRLERQELRDGLPAFTKNAYLIPHLSLARCTDNQLLEEAKVYFERSRFRGSELLLGPPEVIRVRSEN